MVGVGRVLAALAVAGWLGPWCRALAQDPAPLPPSLAEVASIVRSYADARSAPAATEAHTRLLAELDASLLASAAEHRAALVAEVEAARAKLPAKNPTLRAFFEGGVAGLLFRIGLHREALRQLESYCESATADELGPEARVYLGYALAEYAQFLHFFGDSARALAAAERARVLCREDDRGRLVLADAHGISGRIHASYGVLGLARLHLDEQRRLAEELEDPQTLLRSALCLAEYHYAQGRPRQALQLLQEMQDHDTPVQAPNPEVEALSGLLENELENELAPRELQRSSAAEASLRGALKMPLPLSLRINARLALAEIELRRGDRLAARHEVDLAEQSAEGNAAEPWDGSSQPEYRARIEAARAGVLRAERAAGDTSATDAALRAQRERLATAIQDMIAQWRKAPIRKGGLGFLTPQHRRAALSEWIQLTELLHGPTVAADQAAALLLALQCHGSLARELGVEPIDVDTFQRSFLGPDDGALVFLAARSCSHVLVVDRDDTALLQLPRWQTIVPQIDELRDELWRSPPGPDEVVKRGDALRARSAALAATLLGPELRRWLASWRHVTVADCGLLRGLPLECLMLDEDRLLGEVLAVSTVDSFALGVKLQGRVAAVPAADAELRLWATLARPPGSAGASSKESRDAEFGAARAARLTAAWPRHVQALDQYFTVEAFSRDTSPATVTHLVAHGARLSDRERPAGLAASAAGGAGWFLGCDEIDRVRVQGLFLVSACGAGRGPLRTGDEVYHSTLAGALLRGGAHSVIQSSADLLLEPHLDLMEQVHRALASGDAPAAALQQARASLADRGYYERFQHAQVQAFGAAHRPVVRRTGRRN